MTEPLQPLVYPTKDEQALRYNQGKPEYSMIDLSCLEPCARVLGFGAKKYSKYGECSCHVKSVEKIFSLRKQANAKVVTIPGTKWNLKIVSDISNIAETTQSITESVLKNIKPSIEGQERLSKESIIGDKALNEPITSQIQNWIDSFYKILVEYAEAQTYCASTMTIERTALEQGYANLVISLLDWSKERAGWLMHSTTCENSKLVQSGRDNWKLGMPTSKILDSMLRHIAALQRGEIIDPESGLPHLGHVQCNALFLGNPKNEQDIKVFGDKA